MPSLLFCSAMIAIVFLCISLHFFAFLCIDPHTMRITAVLARQGQIKGALLFAHHPPFQSIGDSYLKIGALKVKGDSFARSVCALHIPLKETPQSGKRLQAAHTRSEQRSLL